MRDSNAAIRPWKELADQRFAFASRYTDSLFGRGQAFAHQRPGCRTEIRLAQERVRGNARLIAAIIDQLAQCVIDADRLEYADPALEAGMGAMFAAGLAVDHRAIVKTKLPSAWIGVRQCSHSFLTRRWAITARSVEASRNGSTFMSRILVIAPTASLVCTVESTR